VPGARASLGQLENVPNFIERRPGEHRTFWSFWSVAAKPDTAVPSLMIILDEIKLHHGPAVPPNARARVSRAVHVSRLAIRALNPLAQAKK